MLTGLLFIVVGAYLKTKVCQLLRENKQAREAAFVIGPHVHIILSQTRKPNHDFAPGYEVRG